MERFTNWENRGKPEEIAFQDFEDLTILLPETHSKGGGSSLILITLTQSLLILKVPQPCGQQGLISMF